MRRREDVERSRVTTKVKRGQKENYIDTKAEGSNNLKDYCIVMAKLGVEGRVGDDVWWSRQLTVAPGILNHDSHTAATTIMSFFQCRKQTA